MPTSTRIDGASTALDELDETQVEAALRRHPFIVLTGGPGTGKTRTLVARTAEQIRSGTPYERIAVCTFTRAAAQRFREAMHVLCTESPDPGLKRLLSAFDAEGTIAARRPDAPPRPWIGTIHELCARVLRATPSPIGWPETIETIRPAEAEAMRRTALIRTGLTYDSPRLEGESRAIGQLVSKRKRAGLRAEGADPITAPPVPGTHPPALHGRDAQVASLVDTWGRAQGRMDYDDILSLAWTLLCRDSHARAAWRMRFDQIVIDEAQDTEPIQLAIIALIAGDAEIMAAGDSSQAIYGWRGATGTLDRNTLYPLIRTKGDPEHLTLRNDYRHTHTLARAAESLRLHMPEDNRAPMRFGTGTRGGTPDDAVYVEVEEEAQEGLAIEAALADSDPQWSCAVLCRTRRRCEQAARDLARTGRPIWLDIDTEPDGPAGTFLAWLRAATEPGEATLEAALHAHWPQVRLAAFDRARHWSATLDARLRDARIRATLGEKARKAAELWHRIAGVAEDDRPGTAHRLVDAIVQGAKLDAIAQQASPERAGQYQRLMEVARALLEHGTDIHPKELATSLTAPLVTEKVLAPPEGAIVIRTMHGAKGLESDHIISPGWIRGMLPASFADSEAEERNVAYVTLTRARQRFTAIGFRYDTETGAERSRSPFVTEARLMTRTHPPTHRSNP